MWQTYFLLVSVFLLALISPGPDFFVVLRASLSGQRQYAWGTVLGIALGVTLHATYAVLGLAVVFAESALLFAAIKYAGAAYLLYLGWMCLMNAGGTSLPQQQIDLSPKTLRAGFMEGFLCNLLNPKATLFFLSVFTQILGTHVNARQSLIAWLLIVTVNFLYWLTLSAVLANQRVQKFYKSMLKTFERIFGTILLGLGLKVLLTD